MPTFVPHTDANLLAFLRAHAANSHDRHNSLVLADYLDEHDDPRADIARRHGEGDAIAALNPEGKRLFVKAHEDFIPLTPADKTSWGIPAQKVRVHVYGVTPGKDRPRSPNHRLEAERAQQSVPIAVRLAFGNAAFPGELAGHFHPHEAVRLVERFHPETAARLKKVIAQGFGGTLPPSEPPAPPAARPDAIDHNAATKPKKFADAPAATDYTTEEYVAAYARLCAEGDRDGCKRLRKVMARGAARAFATDVAGGAGNGNMGRKSPPRSAPMTFAADHAQVADMLTQLASPEHVATRAGHPSRTDFRGVLADALQDHGRDAEAEHLRTPARHVMVHQGQVVPARYTPRHVIGAEEAFEGEVNDALEPSGGYYEPGHAWEHAGATVRFTNPFETYHDPVEQVPVHAFPRHLADFHDSALYNLLQEGGYHIAPDARKRVQERLDAIRTAPFEEPASVGVR